MITQVYILPILAFISTNLLERKVILILNGKDEGSVKRVLKKVNL